MTTVGRKLFWGIGVPALALSLLGVASYWQRTSRAVHESKREQARALAELVSTTFNLTPHTTREQGSARIVHRAVGEAVRSDARLFQAVKSLRVLDPHGVVRWSRKIEEEDKAWPDSGRLLALTGETIQFDDQRAELVAPLGGMACGGCHAENAFRVGVLQLEMSPSQLQEQVNALFMDALRYAAAFGTILAAALVFSLHFFLTRPLRRLALAMQRAEQGDMLVRAQVDSRDEVGRLAAAFNRMLARMTAMKAEEIETQRDLSQAQAQLQVQAALADTNAVLERRLNALSLLYDVARSLTATLELPELLGRISELVVRRLKIDHFSVMLLEADGRLTVKLARPSGQGTEGMSFEMDEGAAGKAAATLRAIYVPDVVRDEGTFVRRSPYLQQGSLLSVPMIHQNSVLGVLNFERPQTHAFASEEMELLTAVADQAAMAVKNAKLHEETVALSITDPLTGAPNRRHLFSRLEMEIARAHRFGTSVSLLMIDIDHFKVLNDASGHRAGDITLRQVSDLIRNSVRKVDTLGRYGGEEFILVLPQIQRPEAVEVAEKIRRAVEEYPFTHRGAQPTGRVTISIGVASLPADANMLEKLVDCADAALYAGKRAGRNRVMAYEPGMETHPGRPVIKKSRTEEVSAVQPVPAAPRS